MTSIEPRIPEIRARDRERASGFLGRTSGHGAESTTGRCTARAFLRVTQLRVRTARRAALVPLLLGVMWHSADAQGCAPLATISADRPGTLTGPVVLAKGTIQVESGWAMLRQAAGTSHTIGGTLLRVGGCRAELRLATGGIMLDRSPDAASTSGIADGYVGTKIKLVQGSGVRPHLALLTGASIPVGGAFSRHSVDPDAALSALWDLPGGQSATAYAGVAARVGSAGREGERTSGVSWAVPVGTRVGSFVEFAEVARRDQRARYLTTGLQVFPNAALQIDGFVAVPLPRTGSDAVVGIGLARSFGRKSASTPASSSSSFSSSSDAGNTP